MKTFLFIWFILLLTLGGIVVYAYSGRYDISADTPHWAATTWLLNLTREHALERNARTLEAPELGDARQLAEGAEHYDAMCKGCHLAPGMKDTELRAGLYPRPPDFANTRSSLRAEETFWVIKRGLKMTA